MKFQTNLSMLENIYRFFGGMLIALLGGFLGHYVSSIFFILVPVAPILFITAILGWCPLYELMGINHATKKEH
ncbi:MAG: DUF2892 domain-containing protein [Saprospiraceae bacterium]|nr:DUF2892 domain-containing protein [Saprospiraceae bacterium]